MRKLLILVFAGLSFNLYAAEFTYKYFPGAQYRIVSNVEEKVSVDGSFSHFSDILSKISISIDKVENERGYLKANYQTSHRSDSGGGAYAWDQEYYSEFWRDNQGKLDIAPRFYMPIVRDVPFFPDEDIEIGTSWSSEGEEVHDFRLGFGLEEPFRFPILPVYKYTEDVEIDGRTYHRITIDYTIFHNVPNVSSRNSMVPIRMSGYSSQVMLWDPEFGRPQFYEEAFHFVLTLSNGSYVEYQGIAEAEVVETTPLDKPKVVEKLIESLSQQGIVDAEIIEEEKGVTIRLEKIQFLPDSAILRDSEKEKLQQIGEILKEYPDRDLLITGHTALAGTEAGRQHLSEARAKTVGDFLIALGVRDLNHLVIKGMGAREPIADNSTEEGKQKNRRVEITILNN